MDLIGKWYQSYDSGKDYEARKIADEIGSYDQTESAVFLAHLAVSDSIHLHGQARKAELAAALERMRSARPGIHFNLNAQPRYMLQATISTMLGDRRAAMRYATIGCKSTAVEQCISGAYIPNHLFHSRLTALQNYETATLYMAIGQGDKTNAIVREAAALRLFDQAKSHSLISDLKKEGRFTPSMQDIYCDPASPVDPELCPAKR